MEWLFGSNDSNEDLNHFSYYFKQSDFASKSAKKGSSAHETNSHKYKFNSKSLEDLKT